MLLNIDFLAGILNQFANGDPTLLPDDALLRCYLFCITSNSGIIDNTGLLNFTGILLNIALLNDHDQLIIMRMGSKCRKQKVLPPCDRAYELHKCLKLSNPEVISKVLLKKNFLMRTCFGSITLYFSGHII